VRQPAGQMDGVDAGKDTIGVVFGESVAVINVERGNFIVDD
jgi:hypothetical protein